MRSNAVVIGRIAFQNPAQTFLAQNDDMVQTLAPNRSAHPFGKAVLPGRGWCNRFVPDAHGSQSAGGERALESITIPDHVIRSTGPRQHLRSLTRDPLHPPV